MALDLVQYYTNSVELNICDMRKDQEGDYNKTVAGNLIPPFLAGAGMGAEAPNIDPTNPRSKEYMAGQILSLVITGEGDIDEAQVYKKLQEMNVGQTGEITVRWSQQTYRFQCFDNNIKNGGAAINNVQAFLSGAGNICRFTDTTRGGALFLANYPPSGGDNYNFIQAHTPPVENDPCGKMNLVSVTAGGAGGIGDAKYNVYKDRYFVEEPTGNARTGYPKVRYPVYTNGVDPMSHMFITREINIEYKGIKDPNKGNLLVTMTYINAKGKPVFIDEQTNTAGAFQKIKQKFKKAFSIETSLAQHEMIHLSKLNGDVGQVLEKWREIKLQNFKAPMHKVNSIQYSKAFEAYDSNAIMKAFLEGVDVIFFHIWKQDTENIIICKKSQLDSPKKVYENLINNYTSLFDLVTEEVETYNDKIDEIKTKRANFKATVEAFYPTDEDLDAASEDRLNEIYKTTLEHFCTASVLENLVPPAPLVAPAADDLVPVPQPVEITYIPEGRTVASLNPEVPADLALITGYSRDLQAAILSLNETRRKLVIPAKYIDIQVLKNEGGVNKLADVDLEKEILFQQKTSGELNVKPGNIKSTINILQEIRSSRPQGIFSSANATLGLQLIQFAKKNFIKNHNYFTRMWDILGRICAKNPKAATNYAKLRTILFPVAPIAMAMGGRSSISRSSQIECARKSNIQKVRRKFNHVTRNLRTKNRRISKKINKLRKKMENLNEAISSSNVSEVETNSESRKPGISLNEVVSIENQEKLPTIIEVNEKNNNSPQANKTATIENIVEGPAEKEEKKDDAEIIITFEIAKGQTEEAVVNIDKILDHYSIVIDEIKSALDISKQIYSLEDDNEIIEQVTNYMKGVQEGGAEKEFQGKGRAKWVVIYGRGKSPKLKGPGVKVSGVSDAEMAARRFFLQKQREYLLDQKREKASRERRSLMIRLADEEEIEEAIEAGMIDEDTINDEKICSQFCAIEFDRTLLDQMNENLTRFQSLRITAERIERINQLKAIITALETIDFCESPGQLDKQRKSHKPDEHLGPAAMVNAHPLAQPLVQAQGQALMVNALPNPNPQVVQQVPIANNNELGGGSRKKRRRFKLTRKVRKSRT